MSSKVTSRCTVTGKIHALWEGVPRDQTTVLKDQTSFLTWKKTESETGSNIINDKLTNMMRVIINIC
jgi:hypothetical protein